MFRYLNDEQLVEVYELLQDNAEYRNKKLLELYSEESWRIYAETVEWLPVEVMDYMLKKCKEEMIERFISIINHGGLL